MPKTTNLLQEIMVVVQNHTKFPSLALFVTGLEQRSNMNFKHCSYGKWVGTCLLIKEFLGSSSKKLSRIYQALVLHRSLYWRYAKIIRNGL